ncbi:MAG: PIN domain-containing protein [Coriobacteriia bacterium]|nr:PIN domain-containing protein [Coriobacteriia bacterium]
MRVVFDTDVVLDVLLDREPHVDVASKLFALVDNGRIEGMICATTATTIHHIAAKSFGSRRAVTLVRDLLGLFDVAPVDRDVLDRALDLRMTDYEDAVLHESAQAAGATAVVTRDGLDFAQATMPVLAPLELLAAIAAKGA